MSKSKERRGGAPAQSKAGEKSVASRSELPRPRAVPPLAHVRARHEGEMITRAGRGFSLGELTASRLPFGAARQWGLQLDLRRRTVLEENVQAIKAWEAGPKREKVGEAKKVEGELTKVKKEVKKEAAKAKKEAKKVEEETAEAVEKAEAPLKKRARKKRTPSKKS